MTTVFSFEVMKSYYNWYNEIYAEVDGQKAKIRCSNTPHKTKRAATADAQKTIVRYEQHEQRSSQP